MQKNSRLGTDLGEVQHLEDRKRRGVSKEEWEEMDSQPGQKQGKWDVPEVKMKIAP